MIKKAYKCALKDDQIEKMLELIKDNNNLIEIQLFSIYPILVLETNETDMVNKPNAVWLNNKIDELLGG